MDLLTLVVRVVWASVSVVAHTTHLGVVLILLVLQALLRLLLCGGRGRVGRSGCGRLGLLLLGGSRVAAGRVRVVSLSAGGVQVVALSRRGMLLLLLLRLAVEMLLRLLSESTERRVVWAGARWGLDRLWGVLLSLRWLRLRLRGGEVLSLRTVEVVRTIVLVLLGRLGLSGLRLFLLLLSLLLLLLLLLTLEELLLVSLSMLLQDGVMRQRLRLRLLLSGRALLVASLRLLR